MTKREYEKKWRRWQWERAFPLVIAVLCVLVGVLAPANSSAATAPHRYTPRHGHKCRTGYHRVVKHGRHHARKTFCVKEPPRAAAPIAPTSPAPSPIDKVKLHSHLDPTFTRDPLNPFAVTYAFSASATQEVVPQAQSSAAARVESAPLPSGVLSLFSDGKLECAVNVGGSATGSECPVSYPTLGAHSVTTIYTSGEQSATETEVEQIEPLATSVSATVTFADQPPHEVSTNKWQVGTLTTTASGSVAVSISTVCSGEAGCFELEQAATPVYVEIGGFDNSDAPIFELLEPRDGGILTALDHFSGGALHVKAALSPAAGYLASAAAVPISFSPRLLPVAFEVSAPSTSQTEQFQRLTNAGSYVKTSPAGVDLHVRYEVERRLANERCIYQVRVDGDAVNGDTGFRAEPEHSEGRGVRDFGGLGAGSHNIEIWARGSEPGRTCTVDGRLIVSE